MTSLVYLYQLQDTVQPVNNTVKEIISTPGQTLVQDSVATEIVQKDSIENKIVPFKKTTVEKVETIEITKEDSIIYNKPVKVKDDLNYWNIPEFFVYKLYTQDSLNKISNKQAITELPGRNEKDFIKQNLVSNDWIFWLFITVSLLFLWIQLFYRKYFSLLFNSVFNYQVSLKLYTEKNILAKRVSLVLNFIYTISLSIFIYIIIYQNDIVINNFNRFSLFLLIYNLTILFSIIKLFIHSLTGYVFMQSELINIFFHNIYIINKVLGVILLPISFIIFYLPDKASYIILIVGIVIVIVSVLIKIMRIISILIQNAIFNFYSFLYLCTLEILPILIGYKFLVKFT